ncbi:276_t:CDS:2 [Ambispora leptoticha]|uniref:276_t:CDS:1 n=1 Tax=Ambispora leptoticha TaxID=144679 RepID=A0A9N9DF23_9GLOM|nr:276_t:CDS:2 [Ambispora leptoticha]
MNSIFYGKMLCIAAPLSFLLLLSLIPSSSLVLGGCKNYDSVKKCPIESPCCNNGWCSNDPRFCSTGCDPDNSYSPKSCYPTAYCVNLYDDFNAPKMINAQNYSGNPNTYDWTSDFTPDYASSSNSNLVLSMKYDGTHKNEVGNYQGFGSTVSSTRWMQYGWVTARIKTASSNLGVVSSFITKNLEGDEIDFEWVGLAPSEVQSNFYWQGVLDYSHANHHNLSGDSSATYYNYGIEWMPDHITWYIDGNPVRTIKLEDTKASNGSFLFPSGPQRIQFSVWDGGEAAKGTADWAGTPTDWSDKNRVYTMYVDWVNITCYYQGNETATWPPAGYGPPNVTTNGTTSYQTLGTGQATLGNGGGNTVGSYNTSSIPPPDNSAAVISSQLSVALFSLISTSVIASISFTFKHL